MGLKWSLFVTKWKNANGIGNGDRMLNSGNSIPIERTKVSSSLANIAFLNRVCPYCLLFYKQTRLQGLFRPTKSVSHFSDLCSIVIIIINVFRIKLLRLMLFIQGFKGSFYFLYFVEEFAEDGQQIITEKHFRFDKLSFLSVFVSAKPTFSNIMLFQ